MCSVFLFFNEVYGRIFTQIGYYPIEDYDGNRLRT